MHRDGRKQSPAIKDALKLISVLEKLLPHMNEVSLRVHLLSEDEKEIIKPLCPADYQAAMYVGNVLEDALKTFRISDRLPRTCG